MDYYSNEPSKLCSRPGFDWMHHKRWGPSVSKMMTCQLNPHSTLHRPPSTCRAKWDAFISRFTRWGQSSAGHGGSVVCSCTRHNILEQWSICSEKPILTLHENAWNVPWGPRQMGQETIQGTHLGSSEGRSNYNQSGTIFFFAFHLSTVLLSIYCCVPQLNIDILSSER